MPVRSMDPAQLSVSKRFLPASAQNVTLFCMDEKTHPLCLTQRAIDEATIWSSFATLRCRGKPVAGVRKSYFSARARDSLAFLLRPSESELEEEDSQYSPLSLFFFSLSVLALIFHFLCRIRRWLQLFVDC